MPEDLKKKIELLENIEKNLSDQVKELGKLNATLRNRNSELLEKVVCYEDKVKDIEDFEAFKKGQSNTIIAKFILKMPPQEIDAFYIEMTKQIVFMSFEEAPEFTLGSLRRFMYCIAKILSEKDV